MKDHYLPQVYLKQFRNSAKMLWKYKVISTRLEKSQLVSTAQVCYGHDFYKIDFAETLQAHKIDNPLFLEKKGLKNYEDKYEGVINAIRKRESFILTKHARFFINGLLLIKLRNDRIRKSLLNTDALQASVDNVIGRMKESIQKFEQETGLKLLDALENRKQEFLSDERSPKDMHLRILLDEVSGGSELTESIITFLMNSHWFIFHASPSHAFIYSDNPGFTITSNEQVENLKFSEKFTLCFPLTPSCAIIIMSGFEDRKSDILSKIINYRKADASLVTFINRATIANCNKDIFSNDAGILERAISDYRAVTQAK